MNNGDSPTSLEESLKREANSPMGRLKHAFGILCVGAIGMLAIYFVANAAWVSFGGKPFPLTYEDSQTEESVMDAPVDKVLVEKCSCKVTGGDCSNAAMNTCLRQTLDSVIAEREWKYQKLVQIKQPQINEYDLTRTLDSYKSDLQTWHTGFESARNTWCDAAYAASGDNGVDNLKTECRLQLEVSAISMLDNLYYNGILKSVKNSEGVIDYESKTVSKTK